MDCCFGRKHYAVTGYDVNPTEYVNVVWGSVTGLEVWRESGLYLVQFSNSHNRMAKGHPLHVWAFQFVQTANRWGSNLDLST